MSKHQEAINHPVEGPAIVAKFADENPSGRPGKKRGSIDWLQFKVNQGTTSTASERCVSKMMDVVEYQCFMERKRKWKPEQSLREWERLAKLPAIVKDHRGCEKGKELRLSIPQGDFLEVAVSSFMQKSVESGSKVMKKVSEDEYETFLKEAQVGHSALSEGIFKDSTAASSLGAHLEPMSCQPARIASLVDSRINFQAIGPGCCISNETAWHSMGGGCFLTLGEGGEWHSMNLG